MSASIDTYRSVDLGTASPQQIIIRLFEAAGRYLDEAVRAFERDEPALEALGSARSVVGGLMISLNFEAGEMARNLLRIYLFALDRIHTSITENRDAGLEEAIQVLGVLRSAWQEMPAEAARQSAPAAGRTAGVDLRG
jgi:flagellar protein FliS